MLFVIISKYLNYFKILKNYLYIKIIEQMWLVLTTNISIKEFCSFLLVYLKKTQTDFEAERLQFFWLYFLWIHTEGDKQTEEWLKV